MDAPAVTRVVEDYLTLIWKATEYSGGSPSTTDLAGRLGVTPSTVSATLKKLARDGLITYEPYGSFELTAAGTAIAVPIVRRHRVLETYLARMLHVPWDQVHAEADRLEHAVSDTLLASMDDVLGHPTHDPHGDPIPDPHGNTAYGSDQFLSDTPPGAKVRVSRISDRSSDLLRYLDSIQVSIGTRIKVEDVNKAAAAVSISRDGERTQLSLSTADAIRVIPD